MAGTVVGVVSAVVDESWCGELSNAWMRANHRIPYCTSTTLYCAHRYLRLVLYGGGVSLLYEYASNTVLSAIVTRSLGLLCRIHSVNRDS